MLLSDSKLQLNVWTFAEKKDVSDKEADSLIFANNNNINGNNSNNAGSQLSSSNWCDEDVEFSSTFNVPDMDISAGTMQRLSGRCSLIFRFSLFLELVS